jgi:endonuclease III
MTATRPTFGETALTAGEVIERLEQFPGIGQKKAHMTARLLQDEEEVRFSRWDEINVAVDVHVKRVFRRAGLVRSLILREILAAAVRLHPRYPGQLDYPAWRIGMTWCHARRADCTGRKHERSRPCPLLTVCPKERRGHLPLGP